jgi:hypothetical protein
MHMEPMPSAIRIWVIRTIIRASIPRTVVRQPVVIDHRRDSEERPPSKRELYDLALNVLNTFVEPRYGVQGEREPVKCFRGHCSAFAARHHCDFAHDFLEHLGDGRVIEIAEIQEWIEHRRQLATADLGDTESYLEALPA